jgi:SAM-dependent methyltransferase
MTDNLQGISREPAGKGLTERLLRAVAGKSIKTANLQDREKWLEQVLKEIPACSRILDAGAGETQYKKFCKHLNYVSQDFGQYDGLGDSSGLQEGSWDNTRLDIVCDITSIPEPDESFDAVMCIEVLEHLPEPIKALKELSRLLRPGGTLILSAPFASLSHFAPYHFYSGFSRHFYKEWLPEFGFEVISLVPNGNYFEYLCQELGRLRFVSKKYVKGIRLLNLLDYFALWVLLKTLKRFSKNDTGSEEMLCYGYHVLAVKT